MSVGWKHEISHNQWPCFLGAKFFKLGFGRVVIRFFKVKMILILKKRF
jgi:hypothetical protein